MQSVRSASFLLMFMYRRFTSKPVAHNTFATPEARISALEQQVTQVVI